MGQDITYSGGLASLDPQSSILSISMWIYYTSKSGRERGDERAKDFLLLSYDGAWLHKKKGRDADVAEFVASNLSKIWLNQMWL